MLFEAQRRELLAEIERLAVKWKILHDYKTKSRQTPLRHVASAVIEVVADGIVDVPVARPTLRRARPINPPAPLADSDAGEVDVGGAGLEYQSPEDYSNKLSSAGPRWSESDDLGANPQLGYPDMPTDDNDAEH